jgi:AraC-like DNA-binding protein
MTSSLPRATFSTRGLSSTERYEAWRDLVSAVFEPTLPNGQAVSELRVEAVCTNFGQAMIAEVNAGKQSFTRSRRLIAREGLDHYMIQVYRAGVCNGTYGQVSNIVHPGDVKIVDFARPFHTTNTDFANISLVLPRGALAPLLERPDSLHGTVLHRDSPIGRVVSSHVRELAGVASRLSNDEGADLVVATARFIAVCLGANHRRHPETGPFRDEAIGRCIRDFIEDNLSSDLLGPDLLTRRFRMSRAHLYRMFAPDGGVAAYIQARRLRRCFLAITDPAGRSRRIGDIAHEMGFSSESHFSHAFRRVYGVSPSEARAGTAAATPPRRASFINDWLRGLRQPVEMRQPNNKTVAF